MPYIPEIRRSTLDMWAEAQSPGELNYLLTRIAIVYLTGKGLSYQTINDVLGALEGAKAEFYRRVAVPFEEQKLAENGDVYVA